VVVIAVVVVLIIVLTGGSDTSSPEGIAESAVSAANDKDIDAIVELTCSADKEDVKKAVEVDPGSIDSSLKDVTVSYELGKVETQGDDRATAEVTMSFGNVPDEAKEFLKDTTAKLALKKESGDWCVSGFSGA
jgi:copper chaperone CopZ